MEITIFNKHLGDRPRCYLLYFCKNINERILNFINSVKKITFLNQHGLMLKFFSSYEHSKPYINNFSLVNIFS